MLFLVVLALARLPDETGRRPSPHVARSRLFLHGSERRRPPAVAGGDCNGYEGDVDHAFPSSFRVDSFFVDLLRKMRDHSSPKVILTVLQLAFTLIYATKKGSFTASSKGIRQRPILPGRVQPSTFGTGELNCCVRYGNRWDLSVIATGNGEGFQLISLCFRSAS